MRGAPPLGAALVADPRTPALHALRLALDWEDASSVGPARDSRLEYKSRRAHATPQLPPSAASIHASARMPAEASATPVPALRSRLEYKITRVGIYDLQRHLVPLRRRLRQDPRRRERATPPSRPSTASVALEQTWREAREDLARRRDGGAHLRGSKVEIV